MREEAGDEKCCSVLCESLAEDEKSVAAHGDNLHIEPASERWLVEVGRKVHTNIGRRPRTSEPGPQNIGPTTYPNRNKLVSKSATSTDTPNFDTMSPVDTVGADDANVLWEGSVSQVPSKITDGHAHIDCEKRAYKRQEPPVLPRPIVRVIHVVRSIKAHEVGIRFLFVLWRR